MNLQISHPANPIPAMNQSHPIPARRDRGFTLTEVLIVIVITVVLAAVALTVTRRAMSSARSAKCIGNLRDIAAAALSYSAENNGCLPPLCQLDYGSAWSPAAANRWWPSFLADSDSPSKQLVYETWRCPEARDEDFQVVSNHVVYSSYTALKPVITFVTAENPQGGMRLSQIRNPQKVWMFGDGGRPVGAAGSNRYLTVAAIERYGKSWATANRPALRHKAGQHAHYVACDGHVETMTAKDIADLDHGAFGRFNGNKVEY